MGFKLEAPSTKLQGSNIGVVYFTVGVVNLISSGFLGAFFSRLEWGLLVGWSGAWGHLVDSSGPGAF